MGALADRGAVAAHVHIRLPTATDAEIGCAVDSAEAYFCEQTGRRGVPQRARLLWEDLAYTQYKSGGLGAIPQQGVASVKRGDTTISYSGASGSSALEARVQRFRVGVIR